MAKASCFNCAYFLYEPLPFLHKVGYTPSHPEEEIYEDACMCPESPAAGKKRDPFNLCDYFLAGGGGDTEGVQKAWDAYINLLIKEKEIKEKELKELQKSKKDWDTFLNFLNGLYVKKATGVEETEETCLNCQHCNKGFFTDQGICVCKESSFWQKMRMGRDITPCDFFEAVNVRKE